LSILNWQFQTWSIDVLNRYVKVRGEEVLILTLLMFILYMLSYFTHIVLLMFILCM